MAFCKYCGTQLEEGQQCTCAESQAARNASANPQAAQTMQAAQAVAANVGTQLLDVFKKFFTAPEELLEEAYTASSQVAQFVVLGIFAVVSLLFMSLFMNGVDSPFLVGLGITVALVAVKAVYAVAAYLIKNTEGSFLNALGLFSVTTIPGTLIIIITFLFSKMSFYVGVMAILMFWIIVDSVYSYLAFKTIIKNTKAKALNAFLITAFIVTLVLVAISYNIALNLVEEIAANAFYSMW
ncbi:MAG: hypothetical protein J6P79_13410 [Pseudobutyrivibrio sp.]|nr:hypothetical protein [Pseudobutyrivibrio sp.]